MTTPTPRSVFVVGDGEGDCLFASGVEQYAKDHFQLCVDEANDFRTGPYTLTEYVPKRDLAARDVELKAIAHHVGGGAFYRDEHGGRLPMRDQVGQHIAELNQQLAARDAELAELRAGTPHAAMVNRFLAWALPKDFGPDCGISFDGRKDDEWNKNKTWPIGTNLFTADQALAMFRHCVPTVTQDSQFHPDWSMLEATRESLREHMAELAEWKRKAEEAASELQMRRTPLNAPGDEELIRQSGIQLRHCSCSGGSGDEAHADDCPLWLDVLAARQWWRDRHVVAWSCSQEAKGGKMCAQWCGHQKYCTAHTRDDIEIAAIAAKGSGNG